MSAVNDILQSLERIEEECKKFILLEKKINAIKQDINEIKGLIGVFLDEQSNRKDTFGKDTSGEDGKKSKLFSIDDIDENDRPSNWNYKIELSNGKKVNLWTLYQIPKGKKILQNILSDDSGDEEIERHKDKIKEFRPEAKALMVRLNKPKENDENEV